LDEDEVRERQDGHIGEAISTASATVELDEESRSCLAIAQLNGRNRKLAADERSRVQVALALAIAEGIEIDTAGGIARKRVAPAGLVQRTEAKLVVAVRAVVVGRSAHEDLQFGVVTDRFTVRHSCESPLGSK
jgi:hypothetical protein